MRCPECGSLDVDWMTDPPDDRMWVACDAGHAWVKEQPAAPASRPADPHPSGGPVCKEFDHDDDGYRAWTRTWVRGYVLNCHRRPAADYLVLHRAHCPTITVLGSPATTWTSGDYIKVCSTSRQLLERWAKARTGAPPTAGCHCM